MDLLNWNTIHVSFKLLCFIAATIMIVHWIDIFQRNEDVSSIEITSFGIKEDIFQPEITICITQPFLDERFSNNNPDRDSQGYIQYLKGNNSENDFYNDMVFENVTINLFEYFDQLHVIWKNGYNETMSICTNMNDCPFVYFRKSVRSFAGNIIFFTCFGIELHHKYAEYVNNIFLHFDASLKLLLKTEESVFVTSNYPKQAVLFSEGDSIWKDLNGTTEVPWLKFKSVEILKRRETKANPCIPPEIDYDSFTIEQHIRRVGCRAPYQNTRQNYSVCGTRNKMRESMFNIMPLPKTFSVPCQGISNLIYTLGSMPETDDFNHSSWLSLLITYTDKVKIITQSQKVDLQALVGYIGGYVGLFLGIK